jgi:hypothetical protein
MLDIYKRFDDVEPIPFYPIGALTQLLQIPDF